MSAVQLMEDVNRSVRTHQALTSATALLAMPSTQMEQAAEVCFNSTNWTNIPYAYMYCFYHFQILMNVLKGAMIVSRSVSMSQVPSPALVVMDMSLSTVARAVLVCAPIAQ